MSLLPCFQVHRSQLAIQVHSPINLKDKPGADPPLSIPFEENHPSTVVLGDKDIE